jgi:hypothetical protein
MGHFSGGGGGLEWAACSQHGQARAGAQRALSSPLARTAEEDATGPAACFLYRSKRLGTELLCTSWRAPLKRTRRRYDYKNADIRASGVA